MWNQITTALSFLTVFPAFCPSDRDGSPADLARSLSFFPIVGLLLGACCLATAYLLHSRLPPLLLAVLLTTVLALLTRGLHLDGLSDLFDGVGGGYTPQRRLEIMKDSRTGTFGSLALILAIVFKVAAFDALIEAGHWPAILLIPALSRYAMVLAAYKSPYARSEGGLGKPFLEHMTERQLVLASFFSIVISVLLTPRYALVYMALVFLTVAVLRRLARRWIGGVTGDVLGAVNEITEVLLLSLAACLVTS